MNAKIAMKCSEELRHDLVWSAFFYAAQLSSALKKSYNYNQNRSSLLPY